MNSAGEPRLCASWLAGIAQAAAADRSFNIAPAATRSPAASLHSISGRALARGDGVVDRKRGSNIRAAVPTGTGEVNFGSRSDNGAVLIRTLTLPN